MANSGIYEEDYESDHNSLHSEHNSPADGYFEQRPFPSSNFVENSSVVIEADAKAREAAESRAGSAETEARSSSHQSLLTSRTRTPRWPSATEQTPLLDAGPAPPDYAAATAHRRPGSRSSEQSSPSNVDRPQSYGSINEPPEERRREPGQDGRWPSGAQGNPVSSLDFSFGPRGNPMNIPNFPFGPAGNPANRPDFPFALQGNPLSTSNAAFFPSGQPQSMRSQPPRYSDQADAENSGDLVRQHRRRRHTRGWRRRMTRFCAVSSWLKWLLVLGVIAMVLLTARGRGSDDNDAIKLPKAPKHPYEGGARPSPTPDDPLDDPITPPYSDLPAHQSPSQCSLTRFTSDFTWKFDDVANFTFTEMMEPRISRMLSISGTVYIESALAEQEHDIVVTASYATSRTWAVTSIHYTMLQSSLDLDYPNIEKQDAYDEIDKNMCLDIVIAIRIKAGVVVENFELATANLHVVADQGIFKQGSSHTKAQAGIANITSISAVHGSVDLAYWSSRQTIIETTTGPIKGNYALHDLLLVKSATGSISIAVDPRKADPDYPSPADFIASSHTGSIHAVFPTSETDIPDRDYRSRIQTQSTSITGSYILGSGISFDTVSGSISPTVLPYSWTSYTCDLHSTTSSGSTTLTVLPAYKPSDESVEHVHSVHRITSTSGSMKLQYPAQWEGRINGETKSGSVAVGGKNVVVDYFGSLPGVGRRLVARNGNGYGHIDFKSISGSVKLIVGEAN